MRYFIIITGFVFVMTMQSAKAAEPMNVTQMCQRIEALQDTDAANYKAGVDVHGNAVAPADLNADVSNLLQAVVIPIELDILKRFEIDVPKGIEMEPELAQLVVHQDGKITFNGQEITQRSAFICSEERLKARGLKSRVTIRGMKVEDGEVSKAKPANSAPQGIVTQTRTNENNANAGDRQPPLDAVNVETVPVVPPQDPLWRDDVITGSGR